MLEISFWILQKHSWWDPPHFEKLLIKLKWHWDDEMTIPALIKDMRKSILENFAMTLMSDFQRGIMHMI